VRKPRTKEYRQLELEVRSWGQDILNEYDGHWLETFTGKQMHFLHPSPDEICIEDIAHALALTCRFGGHCQVFYSVAEHSARVAGQCAQKEQMAALLHDASEAYIHDITRPLKHSLLEYKGIEDKINQCIRAKFNIVMTKNIKLKDNVLLATEARDLGFSRVDWADLPPPLTQQIVPWAWESAERIFLMIYKEINERQNS
jgi:hypothetical protein